MILPAANASDEEVTEWIRLQMIALDTSPRISTWRHRALGMTRAEAAALAPSEYRLDLKIPNSEMRVIRAVATTRGVGARELVRRAFGTWLLACEDIDPESIPGLLSGGIIGP